MNLDKFKGKRGSVKAINYSADVGKLLLVPLGDVHLGAATCNIDKFVRTVEFIQRTDCKVVLMGDK